MTKVNLIGRRSTETTMHTLNVFYLQHFIPGPVFNSFLDFNNLPRLRKITPGLNVTELKHWNRFNSNS